MAKVGGSFAGAEGHAEFSKEEMKQAEIWAEKRERKGEKEQKEREKKMAPKGNPITSFKPPKEWFDKMFKQIHEKHPEYSSNEVEDTIGDIWYHKIDEQKRLEIAGKYGHKNIDSPKKVTVYPTEIKEAIKLDVMPPNVWLESEGAMARLDHPDMDYVDSLVTAMNHWKELSYEKKVILIKNYGDDRERKQLEQILKDVA